MDSVKPKIENLEKNGDFRGGTKNMSVIFFSMQTFQHFLGI